MCSSTGIEIPAFADISTGTSGLSGEVIRPPVFLHKGFESD